MPEIIEEKPEPPTLQHKVREGLLAVCLLTALFVVGWKWQHASAQAAARQAAALQTPTESKQPANHLIGSTSPYLLQHAHNPVDWYPWGPEALELAKRENRPIFLSIGYSACHWCHVMEREDFESEEISKVLNQNFVCIKVDREERPDIDSQYMTALQMMTGSGGWPMSVWLTPDLKPFYGGTYYPAADFKPLLQKIAAVWSADPAKVRAVADQYSLGMKQAMEATTRKTTAAIPANSMVQATAVYLSDFDQFNGGFGSKPKFPQAPRLRFLLDQFRRNQNPLILALLTRTLDSMAHGGIYDQLGGGFHRYSTDPKWLVPHFEKMLYDQSQMAQVYLDAYELTHESLYREVAQGTLDFVLREMTDPKTGAFYATLDADSEGEEGKFYVWTTAQIEVVLGKADAESFEKAYGVTIAGNFEGGRNVLSVPAPLSAAQAAALAPLRAKLLAARGTRIRPNTDDKIVTAWNGLMIGAFAKGYTVTHDERYHTAAVHAADFLTKTLTKSDGSLVRAARQGAPGTVSAFLDDYAFAADGMLDLYAATREDRYRKQAQTLTEQMLRRFWDKNGAGGFLIQGPSGAPIAQSRSGEDDATPSPTGTAAQVLARLAALPATPDQTPAQIAQYRQQVALTAQTFQPLLVRAPAAFPTLLLAWQMVKTK
jgi:uncharacterized protein YyaL (SSP411 family)